MRSFTGRPGLGRLAKVTAVTEPPVPEARAPEPEAPANPRSTWILSRLDPVISNGRQKTAATADGAAQATKTPEIKAPEIEETPIPSPTPRWRTGRFRELAENLDTAKVAEEMHAWMAEVFPLCRSITGKGLRLTLRSLSGIIPLETSEVPTGTRAHDWTIPGEWEIREAWIKDPDGRTVVDFRNSNLHVVGYSRPVRERMPLSRLRPKLHSLPDRPEWIPYRASFWQEDWGFCLPHRQLEGLPEGEYEVCIDSTLKEGGLTYGEFLLPGRTDEEVLISAHCCHPSLANDNLSGMAVAAFAARHLRALSDSGKRLRYSYRFLFAPVTIGALAWLSRNEAVLPRVRHGLVLSLLGDSGPFTYKRSRRGDAAIDRAAGHALAWSGAHHQVTPFSPYGYDERQFCSPGIDLPMGCLMRTPFGRFPEYHTSADNLGFVKPSALSESLGALVAVLDVLENDGTFVNLSPMGEPQLGRRGLFNAAAGGPGPDVMALLWVLNQADGGKSLLETAESAHLSFDAVKHAAEALMSNGLLEEKETPP